MKIIVGIDEVGRGPLAGPVTIGIVACESGAYSMLKKDKTLPKLGLDSKKLKAVDRETYSRVLKGLSIPHAIISISNKIIDSKGISFCIKKAIGDGMKKLKLQPEECQVLLDGGLKAPKEFKKQKTIIKGDEKEKIIAWASILAKVTRDEFMKRSAKTYPLYGFESHKGYGTKRHKDALRLHGLSSLHRRTYCKD